MLYNSYIGGVALFGKRLRYLREKKNMSQKDLAKELDIPNQNISNYEREFRHPDFETLKRLADYFNVSIDYLLGHEVKDIDSMSDEEIDEEIKEIMKEVDVWYKNEPEDKREKLEMLRKIIKTFTDS